MPSTNIIPRVATVIITYNGEQWIDNCLRTLKASTGVELSIIVVDNASSDTTLGIISNLHKDVILLEQKRNLGFGKANNVGIKYAIDVLNVESIFCLSQKLFEVPFINAAAWLLKTETIKQVGLFNPIFPHYGEDNDYIFRVQKSGLMIGVSSCGYIKHYRNSRQQILQVEPITKTIQKRYIKALIYLNNVKLNFYKSYFAFFREEFFSLFLSMSRRDWHAFKVTLNVLTKVLRNTISIYNKRSHKL